MSPSPRKRRVSFLTLSLFVLGALGANIAAAQNDQSFLVTYDLEAVADPLWGLPKELKDVSGLALTPDGRLFAHAEKRAIIHEIDVEQGTIVKTFWFGRPAEKGGFEGMAIAGKRFFLITEKGRLLEGREGFNYESKVFNDHDTTFGEFCEIGGLAATEGKLLILCRKAKKKAYKGFLTIFSWDIATKSADETPYLKVELSGDGMPVPLSDMEPSGVEVLKNGNLLILSTGKKLVLEITPSGEVVDFKMLDKKRHDNPEGIAVTPGGDLILADEGSPAWISVYKERETG